MDDNRKAFPVRVIRPAVLGGSLRAPLSVRMRLDEYSKGLAFHSFCMNSLRIRVKGYIAIFYGYVVYKVNVSSLHCQMGLRQRS